MPDMVFFNRIPHTTLLCWLQIMIIKLKYTGAPNISELQHDINLLNGIKSKEVPKINNKVKEALVKNIKRQFVRDIDADGEMWEPVTSNTLRKRKVSKSPVPLTDRGILASSFKGSATPRYVKVETTRPYAGVHEFGSKKVPKRPMLSKNGELMQGHQKIVSDTIEKSADQYIFNRLKFVR